MKILFDYSIFNHQKLGGISRYFINLDYEINKTINESKIVAPIHYNSFLKDIINMRENLPTNFQSLQELYFGFIIIQLQKSRINF